MTKNTMMSRIKNLSREGFKNPDTVSREDKIFIKQCLNGSNSKVVAQAYWAIGQIGIKRPDFMKDFLDDAFLALTNEAPQVREKALFAIGRTGRANVNLVKDRVDKIIEMHNDQSPKVRMSMIWACENIASSDARIFEQYIPIFENLLDDSDEKYVRGEAPEFFRVIGKTQPRMVESSLAKLKEKLNDACRVTRIHAAGAIRIIEKNLKKENQLTKG